MRHLDVPRVFVVTVSDGMLVFDSPFDEALDEYCSEYTVSFLPWSEARRLHGSWETLTEGAEARGRIPVEEVEFDKPGGFWSCLSDADLVMIARLGREHVQLRELPGFSPRVSNPLGVRPVLARRRALSDIANPS
jgi:hypothetical protein